MKLFKDIYKFLLGEQVATNKDGVLCLTDSVAD